MDLAIGTQQRKARWLAPVAASCPCTSPHWTEINMDQVSDCNKIFSILGGSSLIYIKGHIMKS